MKFTNTGTGAAPGPFMAGSARQCLIYTYLFYEKRELQA